MILLSIKLVDVEFVVDLGYEKGQPAPTTTKVPANNFIFYSIYR